MLHFRGRKTRSKETMQELYDRENVGLVGHLISPEKGNELRNLILYTKQQSTKAESKSKTMFGLIRRRVLLCP